MSPRLKGRGPVHPGPMVTSRCCLWSKRNVVGTLSALVYRLRPLPRQSSSPARRRHRGHGHRRPSHSNVDDLAKLVDSAVRVIRQSRDLWNTLADTICTEMSGGSDEMCWNGIGKARSVLVSSSSSSSSSSLSLVNSLKLRSYSFEVSPSSAALLIVMSDFQHILR